MAVQSFLALVAGKITRILPIQTSAGAGSAGSIPALNAAGAIDITMMPSGVGADAISLPATEAISAGALINVWNNSGTVSMRNANGATGLEAHGFVLAAVASAATGTAYLSSLDTGLTSLTPGADYYLSDSSPGAIVSTAPTTTGHYSQQVGTAVSTTTLQFNPGPMIGL